MYIKPYSIGGTCYMGEDCERVYNFYIIHSFQKIRLSLCEEHMVDFINDLIKILAN